MSDREWKAFCKGYSSSDEELAAKEAELAALREAVHDFLCECALAEDFHRSYDVWQITKGSMDELRKLLEEKP